MQTEQQKQELLYRLEQDLSVRPVIELVTIRTADLNRLIELLKWTMRNPRPRPPALMTTSEPEFNRLTTAATAMVK